MIKMYVREIKMNKLETLKIIFVIYVMTLINRLFIWYTRYTLYEWLLEISVMFLVFDSAIKGKNL